MGAASSEDLLACAAYYPFNGSANDESGNNNHGTVNGATLVTDRYGSSNKAYSFNGTTNSITAPHSASFVFNTTKALSLSAWIKISSFKHQAIAFKGAATTPPGYYNEWAVVIEPDKTLRFKINADASNSTYSYLASSPSLNLNKWSHVVATWDGNAQVMKLFLDGQQVGSTTAIAQIVSMPTQPLCLGYVGDGPLDGLLDDVRIYQRALSAVEVDALFKFEKAPQTGSLVITLNDAENWGPTGPNGRVELFNSSGTLVAQGKANSSSVVTFSGIPAGSGYYYRVYVNRISPWGEQFWGEKTGISVVAGETTYDTHTHNTPYMPNVRVYINNTNELLPDGARRVVSPGTQIRVELDIKNPTYAGAQPVWANGGLYLDRDKSAPFDVNIFTGSDSYGIGTTKKVIFYCNAPAAPGDYYLSVATFASSSRYNTTLTDASGWHDPAFSVGTGVVAYYPFDGNTIDASGNGFDGTIVNTLSLASDRFGRPNAAYVFNGVNEYISLPSSIDIRGSLSIGFWIRTDVSDTGSWPYGTPIVDRDIGGFHRDWSVGLGLGGKVYFNTGTNTSDYILNSNQNVNDNLWTFVVVIRDDVLGTKKIFINGELSSGSSFDNLAFDNVSRNIFVGARVDGTTLHHHFRGVIDDLRFYNRALRVGEIDTLYHEGGWPPVLAPPWKFINTGISHTVIIPTSVTSNIYGAQLAAGDYIGVFYDSLGTLACAGYELWTGTTTIAVSVFGDDPTTMAKDGFAEGEVFKWKVYRASAWKVDDVEAVYVLPNFVITHTNQYAANGISQVSSLLAGFATQIFNLRAGWSLISSYVTPQSTSLDTIFMPVLSDVIIVKNGQQKIFMPSIPVNNIGRWEKTEGYQIKMATGSSFSVNGQRIVLGSTPLSIPLGWSIVPYLRESELAIGTALASIANDIVMVKDQDGKTFIPLLGVDAIGTMKPGQGYQVKMLNARSMQYPMNRRGEESAAVITATGGQKVAAVVPPWFYTNTGVSHTVVFPLASSPRVDGTALVAGDYVGVFYDSSGTPACAGYEQWTGTNSIALAAFGDDALTSGKEGLAVGEVFRWKIWRQSDARAYNASATYLPAGSLSGVVTDTNKFVVNGISGVSSLIGSVTGIKDRDVPAQNELCQNFPNPFNPSTTIRYGLTTKVHVSIVVFNALGQEVARLQYGEQEAGYYETVFDASGLSSGVYIYRIQAGDFVQARKLLLIK